MNREEALKLLRGGEDGIREWNLRRAQGECIPPLNNVDLNGTELVTANASNAKFAKARLRGACFNGANLKSADLSDADLSQAHLVGANLSAANLRGACLDSAHLDEANLACADLANTDLFKASLAAVTLVDSDLRGASLFGAILADTVLLGAELRDATVGGTLFADVDLSLVRDLDLVNVEGPCTVGIDTLTMSRGRISPSVLRDCGFLPWQVKMAELFDDTLDLNQVAEIQNEMFNLRTEQFPWAGGIFISYSHDDSTLVDKLHDRLKRIGFPVWLDRHDLTAGPLQKQVDRALRFRDVVLLVLSESSVKSDWVEHELKTARRKEKEEQRDILCPISLDDSWKSKVLGSRGASDGPDVDWEHLGKKHVLDFSKWKTKAFQRAFDKLVSGLKQWYGRKPGAQSDAVV